MPQQIDVPGTGIVEFPDGMDDAAITSAIRKHMGASAAASVPKGEDVTAGMALRGIPVLGAYVPQAEAAIRAAAQPFTGVGEPGATYAERYAANLPKRQAEYAQAEQESPISSEALKFGGGIAALAPLGATALGARALGLTGPMASRIGFGAASGAGLSVADAAARGHDPGTAALIGGTAGGALAPAGALISRGVRALPPRVAPPPTTAEEAIAAAARGGYTLPSYVATEGTTIPQVASSLRNVPWAGQPITRTHDELIANMGRAASEIAPTAGTAETAGERARTGLSAFIKTRSQEPVSEAYKAVDALIDPNVRVPLDSTREAIGQIMAERTRSRIPGQSKAVQTVFDAVQDPRGMDYAGTKGLRSFLGEKTPMELASQGLAPSEVKRIYGAMSKDLGNVVREAGGPEAFTAWKEANALTRLTKMQQQALSKVVGAEGDAAPEMVFNRLVTFANSKAGADLNRLRLAKQAMGPDAWNEVGSALIARLGKAPNEEFSPQRFMTAFGNMAPAARNELFSGRQLAALTDLFTVSKHIADRITRFGNPSGTARGGVVGQAITGGALFAEPISTISTLVGVRLAAEALSRPAIVRAATAVSRASLSGNPVATRRAIALLRAVAVREGLISAAVPQQRSQPQFAGRQMPFRPGEQEQNLMDSINGPQGYPDFRWVNPAGVDAMLEHSPMSTNIEDRRDELGGFAAAAARMRRQGRRP